MVDLKEIGANILLFCLVFGMSATVDTGHVRKQLRNRNALLTGISLQFIILPFLGFLIVNILNMDAPMGVALLVVTSSPGGSYSNWWCSMFNADLALSVTMTAISTLLSVFNLVLYATSSYSSAVVKSLKWSALLTSIVVVIGGIGSGIACSAAYNSHRFNIRANKMGNLAGIALIMYSILVSIFAPSSENASLLNNGATFYIGVAAPALIGVCVATYMATKFNLDKPERVSVAVEACYQNTGIASSVAIAMFSGDDLATAISVPLCYGVFEAVILAFFCMFCWKIGWTKAPPDESICVVIATSYEVEKARMESPNAIEVVYNASQKDEQDVEDLVFTQTVEGYQIDEDALNETANARLGVGRLDHPSDRGSNAGEMAASDVSTGEEGSLTPGVPNKPGGLVSGGITSLRARATGYRQGSQNPDSPLALNSPVNSNGTGPRRIRSDDPDFPPDGHTLV